MRHHGSASSRHSRSRTTQASLAVVLAAVAMVGAWVPARAAGVSLDLDQFATQNGWQNGDLNGRNTSYPEGGVVPFRLAIEGLKAGNHSIRINYDFTAGGHKAYDFLASWDAWRSPGLCGAGGGAVSSRCPSLGAASTFTFPTDNFRADGLSVAGAQAFTGTPRRLTIYGGSITSITAPVHSGSVSGNSSADMTVRFTSRGSAVLMSWGGHLAQSAYWDVARGGAPDGAGQVSGAPWHMRTLQLDGAGNRNQDRSIQSSAINGALTPPAPPAPAPTPRPTSPPAPAPAPQPTPDDGSVVPPAGGNQPPPAAPVATLDPGLTLPPTAALASEVTPRSAVPEAFAVLILALITGLAASEIALRSRRRQGA